MEKDKSNEVYSKVVRAGKRTYFFDVKSTKGNELYLTITESKKTNSNGREFYQKHKLFLYKEDFEKFANGLTDAISNIENLNKTGLYKTESNISKSAEDLTFEEL